ncbi:flagellar hook-length control protein FliK [Burkholderia vietnamiensis]|uniref:flagellar hook-length control protein FliK n=1 Tax=Burkholderia vietnamiensis TaxID=60552 RepID=UPI0015938619|nr:flagellar hook-length control protein FliK [Burkholderia vietnamiensis]MCA7947070.1 flagellar hook-length control protein FliK [Burkholderia vietnamiensis]HDR8970647.1 flagellar hook-length control protein FliK [Burkholderia vietnamiensis]HDR9145297.1 flagellar hook-length control protein FliK [Burkholderia vietnamiensis]HDR9219616.1 flagellar hook-length control protein FliK [Burkholderia vietnamiensis]
MTGIDPVAAALLTSRIDSLLTTVTAPAGSGAAQVGTPGAGVASAAPALAQPAAPPASAQTALSDVALVLDAISRSGGVATPAIAGRAPLLADPTVLLNALTASPDGAQPGVAAAAASAPASSSSPSSSTPSAATAANAAAAVRDTPAAPPTAALRAALAQAVSESGLFYESHLAQWLAGQRPLPALMREPQARLATVPVQTAADAAQHDAPDPLDELLAQRAPLPAASRTALPAGASATGSAAPHASMPNASAAARGGAPGAAGMADPLGELPDAHWATPARAALAAASADPQAQPQSSAAVHPAAVAIVRQQLDALATDQFRWTGEAWPGARLDWTIEPDDPGGRAPRGGDGDAGDGIAWRTRLTLTLPSLGTVDAELVLNGAQLVARLRASSAGAGRLTRNEAALRQRFEGSGLQLGGLSIRAVGDAPDGFDAFVAQAAAAAYARGGAGGTPDVDETVPR